MRQLLGLFCTLLISASMAAAQGYTYDVLIRNGRIIDGTGGPWYRADVGIRGDTITAIGLLQGTAAVVIDAHGMAVSPGFIDIHTHARKGIVNVPAAGNYIRQGVTTLMEGNDGSSPLPLAPFLERISRLHIAVNFGTFVGQGSIRQAVMGLVDRKATPREIGKMEELARQAMREGAFGISTGLFYVPGNYTPTEELIEVAGVVGEMGGIYISHMRDEGDHVLDSVRETIRIGEEGHLPVQITHHKVMGRSNWGKSVQTLALVEAARARGVDVTIDQYPYTASSTSTAALFPRWSLEGGRQALLKRLHNPGERIRIKASIVDSIENGRGGGDAKNIVMASCGFDPSLSGESLADITNQRGQVRDANHAAETAIWVQEKGGCMAIYHAMEEADLERILRYPFTMIASDGEIPIFGKAMPHPRSYGTFARVLGRYVRELHVLKLEDAVRRMSALPADRLKLGDRGLLRPGMKADVVIFDPATVADKATFAQPHQYAVGIHDVIVNGRPVIRDGKMTGERPGRVLYGPAYGDTKRTEPVSSN